MATTKGSIQRRRPRTVIRKGLPESIPTAVQKSYFMLSDAERDVLNSAIEKYRPSQSEPILVGGNKVFQSGIAADDLLSLGDRGDLGWRSENELHPMGGSRASEGSGKSGSVFDIQSALRTDLARIEEASPGVCCPETGQYWTPKPVRSPPVQLGEKVRNGRN